MLQRGGYRPRMVNHRGEGERAEKLLQKEKTATFDS